MEQKGKAMASQGRCKHKHVAFIVASHGDILKETRKTQSVDKRKLDELVKLVH